MPEPSIVIPTGARPSKACSRDTTRPVICHGYLRRRADGLWLLSTDSYIACALKVHGEAEEGFVPFGALRLLQRGYQGEQVSESMWTVRTDRGHITFDVGESLGKTNPFPDFEKLGVWEGEAADPVAELGVNAHMTRRLAQALGIGENDGCRYEMRKVPLMSPGAVGIPAMLRVTGGHRYPDRIGLQMPVRLGEVS